MQQWEYYSIGVDIDWDAYDARKDYSLTTKELKKLGDQGWELVGVVPLQRSQGYNAPQTVGIEYTFKRPKAAKESKPTTETTPQRASAIQSAGDRNPASETAKSKFPQRAQSAAAKHAASNGKR